VSPIFAATMSSPSQLGMSWTHIFTSNGKHFLFPVCSNFTVLCIFQSFFSKLPSLYRHSDVCFWGFYLLFSLSFLVPSCLLQPNWPRVCLHKGFSQPCVTTDETHSQISTLSIGIPLFSVNQKVFGRFILKLPLMG
jgi:hypothetical protein